MLIPQFTCFKILTTLYTPKKDLERISAMMQYIFKGSLYLCGKPAEIIKQLNELKNEYNTVKELIDSKLKPLEK